MSRMRNTRRQRRADFDHEHHRILHQRDRIQLHERLAQRARRRSPDRTAAAPAPASSAAATSVLVRRIAAPLGGVGGGVMTAMASPCSRRCQREQPSLVHQEMLDDRPERQRREECQRADDDDRADQQPDEQRPVRRQRAARHRDVLLGGQAAGGGQQRNEEQEAADQHRQADGQVVPGRVGADAGERAAVVAGAAGVGVEDLGEAVRTAVVQVRRGRPWRVPVAVLRRTR